MVLWNGRYIAQIGRIVCRISLRSYSCQLWCFMQIRIGKKCMKIMNSKKKSNYEFIFYIRFFLPRPPPRMSPFENPKFWLMLNVQSSHKKNVCRVKLYTFQSSWVSFIPLAPSNRAHHLHCFSLPWLQKPRRNHFTKKFLIND